MFFPWYSLWIGTTSLKEFYISSIGGLFGFPADGFWESCWFDTFADGYLWCVCVYAYVHKCVYIYIYVYLKNISNIKQAAPQLPV